MANKLDIKIDLPNDAEIKRMFDAIPKLEHYDVTAKAVRAGAKPIVKRARRLAPRSTPASRAKRSASQRKNADWDYPLWKTIAQVVRKPRRSASYSVVGPKWPKGNKAYFNTGPGGREQVLWGKRTGKIIPQIRNWIVQAYAETKTQQATQIKIQLRKLMDQMWKRGRNG